MPDPTTLSEKNRAKLDGIVQQMVENKESDDNISYVVGDFKAKYAEKKNPVGTSTSTTPTENTELAPKTGSSASKSTSGFPKIDTNGIAPNYEDMKPAVENPVGKEKRLRKELANVKVTPENMDAVIAETDALSTTIKSNQKAKEQAKSQRVKELETSFYDATRNNDDDAVAEQRLNDAVNTNGVWNNVKSIAKKAYNTTVGGLARITDEPEINNLKVSTDALNEEKELVKKEAFKNKEKLTDTEINQRAQEIFKEKEKENLFLDRANSFLDNMDAEDKNLLKQDRYDKSVHLQEDNLKRLKYNAALQTVAEDKIRDYKKIESQLKSFEEKGQDLPEDLYDQYTALGSDIQKLGSRLQKNEEYVLNNKKDLGTAEQEFNLFKREYGDLYNFGANVATSAGELAVNTLAGLNYIGTLGGNLDPGNKNKGVQEDFKKADNYFNDARETLRKPVESVESIEGFVNYASDLMANQIPNLVATSTGAKGLAMIGTASAGQKFTEMNEEVRQGKASYSPLEMAVAPFLYGSAEVISEIPTLSILKKGGRVIESIARNEGELIVKTAKQKAIEWSKDYGIDMTKEMAGEQFTNFAQNFNDKYVLGKKDVNLLDNTGQVFKDTFTLTSILKAAPQTFGVIAKPFQSKTDLGTLDENSRKIIEFSQQLNTEGLTDTEKSVIQKQINKATAESSKIVANTIGKISDMPGELYDEVVSLNSKAGEIKAQARAINDGNLSNKEQLLKGLSEDYKALQDKRNGIIEGNTTVVEILPLKEQDLLKKQALEDLVTELNPDGKKNMTITNEQILERANEIYASSKKEENKTQTSQPSSSEVATPSVNSAENEITIPPVPGDYNIVDEKSKTEGNSPLLDSVADETPPNVNRKEKQLEIINTHNPAPNNHNTWIRNADDIKTAEEVFETAFNDGEMYPDFTVDDMKESLNSGEVTIYSSRPIKKGSFVTPSRMNAEEYAGGPGSKTYSKSIKINDIAWIDESEGQYAPVKEDKNEGKEDGNPVADGNIRTGTSNVGENGIAQQENPAKESVPGSVDGGEVKGDFEVRQYKTSENGKPYNVVFENGELKITDENGKAPSAPTRRMIEAKHADNLDFTKGETASDKRMINDVSTWEEDVAAHSDNPVEVAETLLRTYTMDASEGLDTKSKHIAEAIGGKGVERSSFAKRTGKKGMKDIPGSLAMQYFAPKGKGSGLDIVAQNAEIAMYGDWDSQNPRITEDDVLDFINDNPRGTNDFMNSAKKEKINALKTAFTHLTGLPANDKYLGKAIEQGAEKEFRFNNEEVLHQYSDEDLVSLSNEFDQFTKEENGKSEKTSEVNGNGTPVLDKQNQETSEGESGIQEARGGTTGTESQGQESAVIDLKSTPDQILEWLENAERELDAFGRENLSVGIPIVVAKAAIQAMKVAVKAGKLATEIIQAGIDAVKQSDWFKNLTQTEQADIENDFQTNFLNKISAINPKNERQAENLLNRAASENISEDDAYDEVKSTFEKARTELSNKKSFKEYSRDAYRNFVKRFTDRQYLAKSLLNKSGMKAVQNLIINAHGASGRAKIHFEEAYNEIYKKLTTQERHTLDEIIQAKRFIAIDSNREARGLEPVSHPNFIDKNKSEKFLSKLEKELGAEKYNDLAKRADAYFKTYKRLLKDMLDNGLISKESFDSMSDVDYQPRVFLQFVTDFNGDLETAKRTNNIDSSGLSSEQIKSMSEGDASSLVLNSEWLLTNSLLSRSKAMAMNNINKRFMTGEFQKAKERFDKLDPKNLKGDDKRFYTYFKELSSKVIDNPVIGETASGNPKFKYDKTPANFSKAYYYIDGQRHEFFLENELHESWNDNVEGFLSRDAKEFISYASGAALVKAIATGNNPAFPIVNTPRDFLFTTAFSDQYSNIVPKAMVQIAKDVVKSIKEIRKPQSDVLKKYIEYGGAMDFLSSQGTLKKESLLGKAIDKAVSANTRDVAKSVFSKVTLHKISQYSEMMFRLGIFQRSIKNQLKDLGLNDISEVTDKQQLDDIYSEAVASARSILDFNQGGVVTKDLEAVIPYINVAFQGGRVAASAFEKDPVGTTSRVLQLATIASTVPIGMSLALISAMKSDDDEDKSVYEIYLHALEGVSKYQKMKYMNIVTGNKNDEGEYQVIKIAKAQELSPVMSITDNIYNNFIRSIAGKPKKSAGSIIEDALFTFNSTVMPIDVTSPAGFITRTPIVKATLTYATGYDFFREEPLSMDIGKVPKAVEGITMARTEDFYKKLGENYGLSPIRSKAFVESLITGPSTNPFVGMLYGGADAVTSDKDMKQIGVELFNTVYKSTGKRVVGYTSDFNRQLAAKEELQEKIDAVNVEKYKEKAAFNDLARQYTNKEITKAELDSKINELEPSDKNKMYRKLQDKIRMKDVDGTILDIKYEQGNEAKALMIMHYYGDIYDGSEESKVIIRQMQRAKGILTPATMKEYNKIKSGLGNKKTPN